MNLGEKVQGRPKPFRCKKKKKKKKKTKGSTRSACRTLPSLPPHAPTLSGWRRQEWSEAGTSRGLGRTPLGVRPEPGPGRASTCGAQASALGRRGGLSSGKGRVKEKLAAHLCLGESDTALNTGVRHIEVTVWEPPSHFAHRLPFSTQTLAPRSLGGRGRSQGVAAYRSPFPQRRGGEGSRRSSVGPNRPWLRMEAPTSPPHLARLEKIIF